MKGSDFQEAKDYTDDSGSCLMIVWAINEDDIICERCKRSVEEHKRIGWYTLSCRCYLKLPLIIRSTHFPVSVMYSFNCSASAMYLQFLTKNIVQRSLYSVSKVFFLYINHNRRADYENKKALTVINSKTKRTKRNENL